MLVNLKKGDILKYRNNKLHIVNNPDNYNKYYGKENLSHIKNNNFDIVSIRRPKKFIFII